MNNWFNLGIIIIIARGVVAGYLNGARKSAYVLVGLIFFLFLSSIFSQAGVTYLSSEYEADKKIASALSNHLSLVLPVASTSFFLSESKEEAVLTANQMQLPSSYLERLTKRINERGGALEANKSIRGIFANILLEAGVFFLFFLSFLLLLLVVKSLLLQPKQKKFFDGLIGAFLGGVGYIIIVAVFLLVGVPFLSLWDNFITKDITNSLLVDFLLVIALFFEK